MTQLTSKACLGTGIGWIRIIIPISRCSWWHSGITRLGIWTQKYRTLDQNVSQKHAKLNYKCNSCPRDESSLNHRVQVWCFQYAVVDTQYQNPLIGWDITFPIPVKNWFQFRNRNWASRVAIVVTVGIWLSSLKSGVIFYNTSNNITLG